MENDRYIYWYLERWKNHYDEDEQTRWRKKTKSNGKFKFESDERTKTRVYARHTIGPIGLVHCENRRIGSRQTDMTKRVTVDEMISSHM